MARSSPLKNPGPALRIDPEGKVLLANKSGQEMLEAWGSGKNKIPPLLKEKITESCNNPDLNPIQFRCGEKYISFNVVQALSDGYIEIFGFDVTS